jgi:hypothetical protein
MNPRVKSVQPSSDYLLEIVFNNGEMKTFDLKPYLNLGLFSELKDPIVFKTVQPSFGTITWSNGLDICPDTLYLEGKSTS